MSKYFVYYDKKSDQILIYNHRILSALKCFKRFQYQDNVFMHFESSYVNEHLIYLGKL